jgi:secreted trypsin-like serine protease
MKKSSPILLLAVLAAVGLFAQVRAAGAASRVVGGTAAQVQSAPWAVFVRYSAGSSSTFCGGSIVDALHVLTAAHCVYDGNGGMVPITTLLVRAGISSYTSPIEEAEQHRGVSSLRVHPCYTWSRNGTADDVALLALSSPLDLSGPAVQAVALPRPGAQYPTAAAATLAGFGREVAGVQPDGSLNTLSATVDDQGSCGPFASSVVRDANAVALCASSPTSSVCNGDSGSGLVVQADVPTIVGIASAGQSGCGAGSHVIFTAVWPPEILRFIQGDDRPPTAPRRSAATSVSVSWDGPLRPGTTLECLADGWDGQGLKLSYVFTSSQDRQVLQQGAKSRLVLTSKHVGETIFCTAVATNDGGSATISTSATSPIAAAPPLGIAALAPISAVRGRTTTVRVLLDAGSASPTKKGRNPPADSGQGFRPFNVR